MQSDYHLALTIVPALALMCWHVVFVGQYLTFDNLELSRAKSHPDEPNCPVV